MGYTYSFLFRYTLACALSYIICVCCQYVFIQDINFTSLSLSTTFWPIIVVGIVRFKRKKRIISHSRNLAVTIIILWEKARTLFYCWGYSTFVCVCVICVSITLNYQCVTIFYEGHTLLKGKYCMVNYDKQRKTLTPSPVQKNQSQGTVCKNF